MKKYFLFLTLLMALLASCKQEDVIPEEDMKKILYDLYFLDGYVQDTPDVLFQADSVFVYEPVFNKYGYTGEDMVKALKYYISDVEVYIAIVKDVRTMLAETEEKLASLPNDEEQLQEPESQEIRMQSESTDSSTVKREKKRFRQSERKIEKRKMKELEERFK